MSSEGCTMQPDLGRAYQAVDADRVNGDASADQVKGDASVEQQRRPPQSQLLVRMATELYEVARTPTGEPFALARNGPRMAIMFRGGRDALRTILAREYRRRHGSTPSATALSDALTVLHGEALEAKPREVHLRVAEHDGSIILDLGLLDGRVVRADASGWSVLDRSPVIFRRTALSGELPVPQRGGTIETLRHALNVTDATWPLVLGWLIAAYIPSIPHPVLLLGGEHGTGKTTAAGVLVSLVDPSPAPVRAEPRDVEGWAVAAAGSWAVAVDNVSRISAWWSDCIFRAVTGDGLVRRALYTDGDLSVLAYRRVIMLTSIDAGALRGDLGDRILLADLTPIAMDKRRSERDMQGEFGRNRPRILGALLDVLAGVMGELPRVRLRELPRMADFARTLGAMDEATGTRALEAYRAQAGRVAAEVIDGDPVASALVALVGRDRWTGTVGELHKRITPDPCPSDWPQTPRALSAWLRRLAPALRVLGISVTIPEQRTERGRPVILERVRDSSSGSSASSAAGTARHDDERALPTFITRSSAITSSTGATSDDHDDHDDQAPTPLAEHYEEIEL
jgi:hypothetical protein